jgi:hypothetical protein
MRLIKNFIMGAALASLATVAAVGTASAAPVGTCASAALSTYITEGFTCTIGQNVLEFHLWHECFG